MADAAHLMMKSVARLSNRLLEEGGGSAIPSRFILTSSALLAGTANLPILFDRAAYASFARLMASGGGEISEDPATAGRGREAEPAEAEDDEDEDAAG